MSVGMCLSFAIFPHTNVCVTLVYICIYIHKCVNWRELWSCGGISVWLAYYRHSSHGAWVLVHVHVVCMHMHMPPLWTTGKKNPEKKHQRAICMFSCQERADCVWGWRCPGEGVEKNPSLGPQYDSPEMEEACHPWVGKGGVWEPDKEAALVGGRAHLGPPPPAPWFCCFHQGPSCILSPQTPPLPARG